MLGWIRAVPTEANRSTSAVVEQEADLIARAKADRQAFEPIYARYLDPVYRYCYRRLGNREAAEDATSQVFYKALTALPTYREGSFGGWLFTIAHNVVIDSYRHQRSDEPIEAAVEVADKTPGPEDIALASEERHSLRALLAQLPTDQQKAVELRLAGLSGDEIAQALGRSLGSVKMLQFRAMTKLRALLGAEVAGEGGQEEADDGER